MGSNLAIVAIPDENDRVWKVSSEKVPHLTVLFLGDSDEVSNLEQIVKFVEHAATQTLRRFYLPVDRRGELGADKADVLFFKKGRYDYKAIRDFRSLLLKDTNIKTAYDSTAQFETPEHVGAPGQLWIPHLTLGYPASPAQPEKEDQYSGFYDVCFHKIAVWTDAYEGPEFLLKDYWDECEAMETIPMDVYMSANDARVAAGVKALEHYGTKGMRWGQRKTETRKDVRPGVGSVVGYSIRSQQGKTPAAGEAKKVTPGKLARLDKRFERRAKASADLYLALHDRAVDAGRAERVAINAKPEFKNAKFGFDPKIKVQLRGKDYGTPLHEQYRKEQLDLYMKNYNAEAKLFTNASGTRQYAFREIPNAGKLSPKVELYTKEIEHAGEDEVTLIVEMLLDDDGKVTGYKAEPKVKSMAQTAELGAALVHSLLESDSLEHYGTKGMRWGQRKDPPAAVPTSAMSHVPQGAKRKTKIQAEGGENHPASDDAIKVAQAKVKLSKSGTAALSNKELQDVANRVELEQRVKRAVQPAGRRFVSNLLRNQGNQAANQFVSGQVKKQLKPQNT